MTERVAKDLGPQARSSHPEEDNLTDVRALAFLRQCVERRPIGGFTPRDLEPAEPAILVGARPQ